MNIAIVCEYNPFHFGHLHQIDQIKKIFPESNIIAIMSGSVRDDNVIDTCNKYGITMAFTGVRLFHH